ncbi:MAG: hypothetical protein J5554_06465 [Paludibacteraceae bacterium]|nr:hypothetical protein [Paludibacteraceae bacterium]
MIQYIPNTTHYTALLSRIQSVKHTLWIGTADIKDLMWVGKSPEKVWGCDEKSPEKV